VAPVVVVEIAVLDVVGDPRSTELSMEKTVFPVERVKEDAVI